MLTPQLLGKTALKKQMERLATDTHHSQGQDFRKEQMCWEAPLSNSKSPNWEIPTKASIPSVMSFCNSSGESDDDLETTD